MKNIMTMQEVLDSIRAKAKPNKDGSEGFTYNRFNKKSFENLLRAMLNDTDVKIGTIKVKNNEVSSKEDIMITQEFRKFLQKILRTAGIDAEDSKAILSKDFIIDNVDGLYEFFTTAMYIYMDNGNKFDMIPTENFKGSLYINNVAETKKTQDAKNPKDGSSLGIFETVKKSHKKLCVKSTCPSYLVNRKKIK